MVKRCWRCAIAAACILLTGAPAVAGEFAIAPVRLELSARAKSGVFTITNDGNEKLNFQIQGMEWTQDAAGKDKYTEARDLIFFPKILSVEAGQEGIIRVGLRTPAVSTEKTYRLFMEELPGAVRNKPEGPGAQINFLIRFGAPIFAAPIQPQDGLQIEELELKRGSILVSAKNTGNRHQMVQGIHLKGTDAEGRAVFELDIADRYVLAGVQKTYTSTVTPEQCQRMKALEVELKTDKLSAARKLEVTRAMCS
jgi:fimbrial chaperone protein